MGQVSIHSGAPNHPKLIVLSDGAFRLWFNATCYCSEHLTDGVLPKAIVPSLKRGVTAKQIGELTALKVPGYAAPLWEDRGDHYLVHDYLDWNDSREEVQRGRARLRERVKRHRHGRSGGDSNPGGNAPCNGVTPTVTNAVGNPVCTEGNFEQRTTNEQETHTGRAREAPNPAQIRVATGPHVNHASCGRVCVPAVLHQELRRKLGGHEDEADAELRAWYRQVLEEIPDDQPIPEDDFAFWRRHFAARYGAPDGRRVPRPQPVKASVGGPPAWRELLERVELRLQRRDLLEWFGPLRCVRDDGDRLVVRATEDQMRWIEKHYHEALAGALGEVRSGLRIEWQLTEAVA